MTPTPDEYKRALEWYRARPPETRLRTSLEYTYHDLVCVMLQRLAKGELVERESGNPLVNDLSLLADLLDELAESGVAPSQREVLQCASERMHEACGMLLAEPLLRRIK
jgi:hypothetical protein